MSIYTDREHKKGLSATLYWMKNTSITKKEKYCYGEYYYDLKDYKEAVKWYKEASQQLDIQAMYKLGYCMRNNLGIASDYNKENTLFQQVIIHDKEVEDSKAKYRLGMCYTYGYGVEIDEKTGLLYFIQGDDYENALYEIGKFYKEGKAGYDIDKKKAEEYFLKAYEGFCEEAIFEIFDMYTGEFKDFKYIREIKEAYSFKLGRLIRVSELNPSKEYFNRLGDFYKKGYPGDTEEGLENFQNKAKKYYKKAGDTNVE